LQARYKISEVASKIIVEKFYGKHLKARLNFDKLKSTDEGNRKQIVSSFIIAQCTN
jgi:hypothetical protein